jgi:hypothetical protein
MTAHKVGEHVEITTEDMRQGRTGVGVRYMLAAGIALVVIGFLAAAVFWLG